MNHKFKLVLLGVFFISLMSPFHITGQSSCPISNILEEIDIYFVERSINVCDDVLAEWEETLLSAVGDETILSIDETRYYIFLGLIESSNENYYEASLYYDDALVASAQDSNARQLRYIAQFYAGYTIYQRSGLNDAAREYLYSAQTTANQVSDHLIAGRVHLLDGQNLFNNGLSDDALRNLESALSNFLAVPAISIPEQIDTLSLMSLIERQLEHFRLANLYQSQTLILQQNPDLYAEFATSADNSSSQSACDIEIIVASDNYHILEQQVANCNQSLVPLIAEVQDLVNSTNETSEQAHLQTILGILYYLNGEYLNAHTIHGQTVDEYQTLSDLEHEALTYYYMARSYEQRKQDGPTRDYYSLAMNRAENLDDPYILGLSQMGLGRYLYYETDENLAARNYLIDSFDSLTASIQTTHENRIEILTLLEAVHRTLGEDTTAQQYYNQLLSVSGTASVLDGSVQQYAITNCGIETLYGQTDILVVERQMRVCGDTAIASLMLTARAIAATNTDPSVKGAGLAYYGLAHYQLENYLQAQIWLGRSITFLNEADNLSIRGATYVYWSMSYYDDNQAADGRQYLETAESILVSNPSNLSSFYLSRIYTLRARELEVAQDWNPAVANYITAYGYLEDSTIPARAEKLRLVNKIIEILDHIPGRELDKEPWEAVRDTINSDVVQTPADNSGSETSLPIEISTNCDVDYLLNLDDLVIVDTRLETCSDSELQLILNQVETLQIRSANAQDEVFYTNYVGFVYFHLEQFALSNSEHDDALELVLSNDLDLSLEALTYFYSGRIKRQLGFDSLALDYFAQAQNISNDEIIIALIDHANGNQSFENGEYFDALNLFDSASTNYLAADYNEIAISLMLSTANLYFQRSNFDLAVERYEIARSSAMEIGDTNSQIQALIGMAQHFKYRGNYDEALALIDEADLLTYDEDSFRLITAERGDIAREQRDYVLASTYFEQLPPAEWGNYPCEELDVIRLYYADYLIDTGRNAQAIPILLPLLDIQGCQERNNLTRSHAQNTITRAYLELGITSQVVLEAVDNSIEFAQLADSVNLNNVTGSYPIGFQTAYMHQARFEANRFRFDDANRSLLTAEERAEAIGDDRALADIALIRVDMFIVQGLYTQALIELQQANDLFRSIGHDLGALETLEQSLQIYLNQADYNSAEVLISEAQERANAGDLPLTYEGLIYFYSAQAEEQRGQTSLARSFYENARRTFQEAEDTNNIFAVELRLIALEHRVGNYDLALASINNLRSQIDPDDSLANARIDLVEGDNYLLQYIENLNRRYLVGESINITALLRAESNYENALENFIKSVGSSSQGQECSSPIDPRIAEAHNRLGALRVLALEYNVGLEVRPRGNVDINTAWCIYNALGNDFGKSEALYNLGRFTLFADNTSDYSDTLNNLYQALDLTRESDPYRRALIWTHIGITYEYMDYPADAINAYEEAAELMSFAYAEISDSTTQRTFGIRSQTLFAYNRLIYLYTTSYLRDSSAENAFFFAEQSRARSYLTQLQNQDTIDFSNNTELQNWLDLRDEITNLTSQIDNILEVAGDSAEIELLDNELQASIEALDILEEELGSTSFTQLLSVDVASLEEVKNALPDDTVMVAYYVIGNNVQIEYGSVEIAIFIITPDSEIQAVSVLVPNQGSSINQVTFECAHPPGFCLEIVRPIRDLQLFQGDALPLRTNLYEWLIQPIENQIFDYENLVIVPHSELNYLSFELLQNSNWERDHYLIDEFESIHYVPSATVYTLLQELPEQDTNNALLLGYSGEGYPNLPYLSSVEQEITAIGEYFNNATLLLDLEATPDQLRGDLYSYDVIHFAAHGLFDATNPLASYIALAPASRTASSIDLTGARLSVSDIYELSLSDSNPLIVVSACDVGNSQLNPGDELEGFSRAFLLTGARGVIASLWPVEDTRTQEFMIIFYSLRQEGMNNAQALTEAKRRMRDLYPRNPSYWAGFILVGRAD